MTDEPKHTYPSRHPKGSFWATDEAWAILDVIKPGLIPEDVRAYLAGAFAGRLVRERDTIETLLKDPVAVHINMLSGGIAKPTWNNIKHLYPEQFTQSCGCIFCDLDIELHEDEQGFHHVIKGSRFNCTAFKP